MAFVYGYHYVWDGDNVVLAFNGSQQLIARYLSGPNTSAYDLFYTTLAEEDVNSLTSAGTVTYDLIDPQGSVDDIVDANGNLVDHIVYGPLGQTVVETNASISHLGGWQGGYTDHVSGMEKFGARWYSLADAVWASQDPIGFLAGDTNLSREAFNDPENMTDPSGLWVWPWQTDKWRWEDQPFIQLIVAGDRMTGGPQYRAMQRSYRDWTHSNRKALPTPVQKGFDVNGTAVWRATTCGEGRQRREFWPARIVGARCLPNS